MAGDGPDRVERRGHLILGDLNAYAKEDPIDVLVEAGFTIRAPTVTAMCSTARPALSTIS